GFATYYGAAQKEVQLNVNGLIYGTYSIQAEVFSDKGYAQSDVTAVKLEKVDAGFLPLSFEVNQGQSNDSVKYLVHTFGYTAYLHNNEIEVVTTTGINDDGTIQASGQRLQFVGANPNPLITGEMELPGVVNYLRGSDASAWLSNIPTFEVVHYHDLYDGIDLIVYSQDGKLQYDFIVKPFADPNQIRMNFADAQSVEINDLGQLILKVDDNELVQTAPVVYQETPDGVVAIRSRYTMAFGTQQVLITFTGYDPSKEIIVDPVLDASTYFGGRADESGRAIGTDASGNVYIAGWTDSDNLPTTSNAYQPNKERNTDAYIAKFNSNLTARLFATYLGGDEDDLANGLAIDSSGNVYVTGETRSHGANNRTAFPETNGSFSTGNQSNRDVFVSKISSGGTQLLYSGVIGANNDDIGYALVLDSSNNAYITGQTSSTNFPTTTGVYQAARAGSTDAFVLKISADGSAISYATYVGGGTSNSNNNNDVDIGRDIKVDSGGSAYVVGYTNSNSFPTTSGAFQTSRSGGSDAFLFKLSSDASALVYSTYIGGRSDERGFGVFVDGNGDAFITGDTGSSNFPTTGGAFDTNYEAGNNNDAFVTKFNNTGTGLIYSTYLGGRSDDLGTKLVVDANGRAMVVGNTNSSNFPTVNPLPFQGRSSFFGDAFVSVLNAGGSGLDFSTYLAGFGEDSANDVTFTPDGKLAITGRTTSSNFPTTRGAFQNRRSGSGDAYVVILDVNAVLPPAPPPGDEPENNLPSDAYEPNDTSDNPTQLGTLFGATGLTGLNINRIDGVQDFDWYTFTTGVGGSWTLSLANIIARGDIHFRVFTLASDNSLYEIGSSTTTGRVNSQNLILSLEAGQQIFIYVYGFDFALGSYDLGIDVA
ncbi:MAG: SBBP repeat-containing protein, partial [Bdellovibrionales bacterium]